VFIVLQIEMMHCLYSCRNCHEPFHDTCAGYEPDSLGPVVHNIISTRTLNCPNACKILKPVLYCGDCINADELDRDQILLSVRETRAVAEWLNDPECPYVLQKVPEDGVCLFRMLYDFAREYCRDGLVRLVEARKQQTAGGGRKKKKRKQ
jgi:hypothetical protein